MPRLIATTQTTDQEAVVVAVADTLPALQRRMLRSFERDLLARTRKQKPDGPSSPKWRFGNKAGLGKGSIIIAGTFVADFPIWGPFTLEFMVEPVTEAVEMEFGPLDKYDTDNLRQEVLRPIQRLLDGYQQKLKRSELARNLFEAIEEPPGFRSSLSDEAILAFFNLMPASDSEIWMVYIIYKEAARRPKQYDFRDFMDEVLKVTQADKEPSRQGR